MFSDPGFLCLALVAVPVLILRWVRLRHKSPAISFSSFDWLPAAKSPGEAAAKASLLMRGPALFCLILTIAGLGAAKVPKQPIPPTTALMIVLDVSSSMTADDFSPSSRLQEAKKHLKELVNSNRDIVMGLIIFAASPKVVVPVTRDFAMLSSALERAEPAGFDEDGTAIGSGIASAVNRLRSGPWDERKMLLVTDGVSNRGTLSPLDAAKLARVFGIRIDAIGIGTDAVSRFWVPNAEGSQTELEARIDIDDKMLASLASQTGGMYQRVRNTNEFRRALSSLAPASGPRATRELADQGSRWAGIMALISLCVLGLEALLFHFVYPVLPE